MGRSRALSLGLILALAAAGCQGRPNEASPAAAVVGSGPLSLGAKRSEVLHQGEVIRSELREQSHDQIMANMTLDIANNIFMGMSQSEDPHLVNLIEAQLGRKATLQQQQRSLRSVQRHDGADAGVAGADKSGDLYNALSLITGMMDKAVTNYELEVVRCDDIERKQKKMLATSQQDVDFANAQAASSRAASLKAQQVISTEEESKLPLLEKQMGMIGDKCSKERFMLNSQLELVGSDISVMKKVFGYFTCAEPAPTMLLALRGGSNGSASGGRRGEEGEDASLVWCPCFGGVGQPVVQVGHSRVQAELLKLRSNVTRRAVQDYLREAFAESERRDPSQIRKVLLAQGEVAATRGLVAKEEEPCSEEMGAGINGSSYRGCQSRSNSGAECQKWTVQTPHSHSGITNQTGPSFEYGLGIHNYCRNPQGLKETIWCYTNNPEVEWEYCQPLKTNAPPGGVAKSSCTVSGDCKVSDAGCASMRDGFLSIYASVVDKRDQLMQDMSDLDKSCSKSTEGFGETMSTEQGKLQAAQGELAMSTKVVVESQQQKTQASTSFQDLTNEYEKQMKECCDNKNSYMSQRCGLQKIRGELLKASGETLQVTDCQVSDWTDRECSASCAGGTQERERTIIAPPQNGTKCPPLKMERECNVEKCPVNCEVGMWSQWTECTAECGGGVKTRSRSKTVEPKFGGLPCPEQMETLQCNPQACNANCELGDWDDWSGCSKKCNTGHRSRRVPIKVPARGSGKCASKDSPDRLGFEECNKNSCMSLLPPNRSVLQCLSKLDVVLVLDGSGSLTSAGWDQLKTMTEKLLSAFDPSVVQVATLVFGGPKTEASLEKCDGSSSSPPDMKIDCGMQWVTHLTNDTAAASAALSPLAFPASTTMTSMALALAKMELTSGRPDANSVVVVVTDAKPMSPRKTAKAAEDVKTASRLIWVPVGSTEGPTMDSLQAWATKPWQDNIVEIKSFNDMPTPKKLNTIIASMCPLVQ